MSYVCPAASVASGPRSSPVSSIVLLAEWRWSSKMSYYFNNSSLSYTDHPEWGDQVVRNQEDSESVKHPLEINLFMACLLGLICFFGFPLNFEIIIRILYDKVMRLKPRYIIQVAVALSGVFILVALSLVVVHFCFGPSETLCHIFVAFFMNISYNCFLLNYFLYLFECFVSIAFPLWHLSEVTPRRVVYGLVGFNLTMAFAMEFPFISALFQVRCALQFSQGFYANGTSFVLFVLCLLFCCINFVITWFHLPLQTTSSSKVKTTITKTTSIFITSETNQEVIELQELNQSPVAAEEETCVAAVAIAESLVDHNDEDTATMIEPFTPSTWLIVRVPAAAVPPANSQGQSTAKVMQHPSRRLSVIIEVPEEDEEEAVQIGSSVDDDGTNSSSCVPLRLIEWRAIRSFLFGAVPLFLIPLPLFIFYFSHHLMCQHLNNRNQEQQQYEQCADLTWLIPYMFFILVSLHALVNPIASLCLNKDFQSPSPIRRLRRRFIQ